MNFRAPHAPVYPARRPHGARGGRCTGECGSLSLETIILAPVALALVFAPVQAGLMYHSRTVASSGAQFGYESARVQDATAAAGQQAAENYLAKAGPRNLENVHVTAERTATTATVRVTAEYPQLLPLISMPQIKVHSSGPVERVTAP